MTTRAELASFIAAEVETVLAQHTDVMRKRTRISAGLLSGNVAAAIAALSRRQHEAIDGMQNDLAAMAKEFVAGLAARASAVAAQPRPEHRSAGQSRSENAFPREEQKDDLSSMIVEDWAGRVGGPTFLEASFGIPRSTLYRWQRRNKVIALLKGGRKYVFPLAQFVDGRPAAGVREVLSVVGHPRLAWFWLTHACPSLNDRKPIDLLRMDMVDEVVAAAHDHQMADGPSDEGEPRGP